MNPVRSDHNGFVFPAGESTYNAYIMGIHTSSSLRRRNLFSEVQGLLLHRYRLGSSAASPSSSLKVRAEAALRIPTSARTAIENLPWSRTRPIVSGTSIP